jgi:hypothetical protein
MSRPLPARHVSGGGNEAAGRLEPADYASAADCREHDADHGDGEHQPSAGEDDASPGLEQG